MRTAWTVFAAACLAAACSKPEPPPEPLRAVRTMTVATQDAGGTREYAAEVRARTESRLGFRVGGKLLKRHVEQGEAVKRGQLLAQLDPQDLRLGQDAAAAALQAAEVNQAQNLADYQRFKDLRAQNFISAAELERRETALKAAQAQLQQAQAQAGVQSNQTSYASLRADVAGVITAVDAEPGAVVAAGTPVLRLAHDGPRDVVFAVPEDQIGLVRQVAERPGALQVKLWDDERRYAARLREVAAAADPATRTFQVKADLGDAPVRLGQTATVTVELPRTAGVVKVPLTAVAQSGGNTVVWLLDTASMTVKPQPVQVQGAEGNEVVIAQGLAPGQTVVTAGVHVLTPGQKVKQYVEPRSAAPAASMPR